MIKQPLEQNQKFNQHPCGLGTFLDIAMSAIDDKLRSKEYSNADAVCLQNNAILALYHLAGIAETLGMERLDYSSDTPQVNLPAALTLFGRAVHELAYCLDSTNGYVIRYHREHQAEQDGVFPPPNGC